MELMVIRGGNLNKWDMRPFEYLNQNKNYKISVIGSTHPRYNVESIKIKKILLPRFGRLIEWMGYPSIILNYLINCNDYLFGLEKTIKTCDIVETADTTYPFTYQAVRSHPKVVCVCYENIPFFREKGVSGWQKRYVREHAAHFIAITEKAKSVLELEGVPKDKITVIPPGIDLDIFKPREKPQSLMKKYDIKKTDITILFVGRLVYDKGIEDLIHAFKLLCNEHDNLKLLILGRGALKNKIIKLIERYAITDKVVFVGFLPYEETEKIYNLSDIVCTPSRITKYWQEQFGFVFVEAMACGKPVVSTYAGAIPEVTGKNALLVSPGNHLELYNALNRLVLNPKLREQLAKKALEFTRIRYDAKNIAKQRMLLYNKLMNENNALKKR